MNANKTFTVTVQVEQPSLSWEDTKAIEHTFNSWLEVSTFAYRLALQMNRKVRVEYSGNGSYYHSDSALYFLTSK